MDVNATVVRELRERTGAGIMDCKKALAESGGNLEKAVDYLRQKGLAAAARKVDRVAADGAVGAYVQLRDGLCRPYRRIPGAAKRYGHAGRGRQSALCAAGGSIG